MSFFYTERRIEELLERETRIVPGPGGAHVSIDGFKAFWKAYDFLVLYGVHSPERLAELAELNREFQGGHFGNNLCAVVWNANEHARRILGIDCFAVRRR